MTLVGEQPRLAYRTLERRVTVLLVSGLLALAALAWWSTIDRARSMSGMAGMDGMDTPGWTLGGMASPVGALGAVSFLLMWVVMMVAMMFPTIAPVVLLHRMVMRRGGGGVGSTMAFAAGYLAVWAVSGVVPLAVLLLVRDATRESTWSATAGGVVLVIAGLYQFAPWKHACLRACQSPMTFLATHDFGTGRTGALRTGASHGLYCLGCCGALMAVLFVVGLMNLTWMALISVIFLLEKHLAHGRLLSHVVGTAVVALGVVVLVSPSVLTAGQP